MPADYKFEYTCSHPESQVIIRTKEFKEGMICPLCSKPMRHFLEGPLGVPMERCTVCKGVLAPRGKSIDSSNQKFIWKKCTKCEAVSYTESVTPIMEKK